tara:strand:- start:4111 stop:4347 length:237 start_codon:yes stop_codon:yes gene_type:complete
MLYVNNYVYISTIVNQNTSIMTNEQKYQMMELIFMVDAMGINNTMVRKHFDKDGKLELHKPKNWSKFIETYRNLIEIK